MNQAFDDGLGKFYVYMYQFTPLNGKVKTEELDVSVDVRIAKKEVVLYHSSKHWLTGTRHWTETVYLPPELTDDGIINALSIALAPIILCSTDAPSELVKGLIAGANGQTSTESTEGERRTIITGSEAIRVTDPDLFCLIPTRWIESQGKFEQEVQTTNDDWEFEF